ncbi:MAG: EndoU domain-containing protein [Treponema sp.]|uniref:EndoU domain-containing protein n=1 Tax=Treponema sp. TaxID=166 RepID=UPI00298EAACC|nr:EndoU domain-containing protein [Treponema sp.]MCQ2053035.1 EndoU domain-containing protein [archaeon]MCQ2602185.1 EndoU domain-containing protein [Treponema sp.]
MGSGRSGIYYTSHGSSKIHHQALIHSMEGIFTVNPKTGKISKFMSGGHAQDNINFLEKNGIEYHIVKTYKNGVRVGYVPKHDKKAKKSGIGQAWFPKSWTQKDITKAAEHVSQLKCNKGVKDGIPVFGMYKGVKVGIIKTHGNIATVFPDSKQPNNGRKR